MLETRRPRNSTFDKAGSESRDSPKVGRQVKMHVDKFLQLKVASCVSFHNPASMGYYPYLAVQERYEKWPQWNGSFFSVFRSISPTRVNSPARSGRQSCIAQNGRLPALCYVVNCWCCLYLISFCNSDISINQEIK